MFQNKYVLFQWLYPFGCHGKHCLQANLYFVRNFPSILPGSDVITTVTPYLSQPLNSKFVDYYFMHWEMNRSIQNVNLNNGTIWLSLVQYKRDCSLMYTACISPITINIWTVGVYIYNHMCLIWIRIMVVKIYISN